MEFEKSPAAENAGRYFGIAFGLALFSTILFLIINLVKQSNFPYYYSLAITLVIFGIGLLLKRLIQ